MIRLPAPSIPSFSGIERFHPRAVIVIALVVVAYHYSLLSVGRGLALQTPLAYIALVPIMAVALAWAAVRRAPPAPSINDRQVDYIIGIGLVGGAAAITFLSPLSLGAAFWSYRFDLLSVPLFAAGLVSIFFGVRRTWLLRWPFAFLLLAWPVPYLPLLGESTRASVEVTVAILSQLSMITPWASQVSGFGSDVFAVQHDGGTFLVSVTAACAGINSLLGFGLVGLAVSMVLRGSVKQRALWLGAGLLLTLALNVIRIEAILGVGALMGPEVAFKGLHPVAGLIAFNVGLVAMLLLAGRFGLAVGSRTDPPRMAAQRPSTHVISIRGALVVGLALAVAFAAVNATYAGYEPLAGVKDVRASLTLSQSHLRGWEVTSLSSYGNGRDLFGAGSTWERARYSANPRAEMHADGPIYLDVIATGDPTILSAYGIQATYPFPGYSLEGRATASVGERDAVLVSYREPETQRSWSLISWVAPTEDATGAARFERVTVLLPDSLDVSITGALPSDFELAGDAFDRPERFLVAIARDIERSLQRSPTP